jgi:GMP synthase (glutamine-hydrolysing)
MGAGLDDGYLALNQSSEPVVVFLDTLHPSQFPRKISYVETVKRRAEELSGLPCIVIHYSQLAKADMQREHIKAILLDANYESIPQFTARLYAFIRQTRIPMIGFCGGCQQICEAYGATTVLMRTLKPGEQDPNPAYFPGYYKEWGFMPITIVKSDPLFAGLPDGFIMQEYHVAEVKQLPPFMEVLASTEECQVQVVKHKDKLHYGTQFHPEDYDVRHEHGRVLLQNFFTLAGATRARASGG